MILPKEKVTQFTHYHLDENTPIDVGAVIQAMLERGFIGQFRIHFNGSHTEVGGGEIVVKKNDSVKHSGEPLTNGPSIE